MTGALLALGTAPCNNCCCASTFPDQQSFTVKGDSAFACDDWVPVNDIRALVKLAPSPAQQAPFQTYHVTLFRDNNQHLGLDVDVSQPDNTMPIVGVKGGLAQQWNAQHPSNPLSEGDNIVEVNGTRGNVIAMVCLCQSSPVLQLVVARAPKNQIPEQVPTDRLERRREADADCIACGELPVCGFGRLAGARRRAARKLPEQLAKSEGLHLCLCSAPWEGRLAPALRLARVLAAVPGIARVSFVTNEFGADRVARWLREDPDNTGKIKVVPFCDGYDQAKDDKCRWLSSQEDDARMSLTFPALEAGASLCLEKLMKSENISLFIVDWLSYPFSAALKQLGAPYCVSLCGPASTLDALQEAQDRLPPLLRGLGDLILRLQLSEHACMIAKYHLARPVLVHSLPGLDGARLPPQARQVGLLGAGTPRPLPDDARAFLEQPGPPAVVVAMGTMAAFGREQLARFAEALACPEHWRVLWSLEDSAQASLPQLPASIQVVSSLPLMAALAHQHVLCSVLPCAWDDCREALLAGRPVVAMPLCQDQARHAERLQALGLARLASRPAAPEGFTPNELRAALDEVLMNPGYTLEAQRWQKAAAAFGGPDHVAEVVRDICMYKGE